MKSKIMELDERRSYNCYSGGVCYLLEKEDVLLSEHISFGLSAGLNFELDIRNKMNYKAVRQLHCLTDCIRGYGVKVIENIQNSYSELIGEMESKLSRDKPFMVNYDGFYMKFTEIYQKAHEKRIGLIVGYDTNHVFMSDFIYGVYQVPITRELFKSATDSRVGTCVGFKWYDVIYPPNINNTITEAKVKNAIISVANYFMQPRDPETDVLVGNQGMKIMSLRLEDIILKGNQKQISWIDFSEDIKQSAITFLHYSRFINDIVDKKLLDADVVKMKKAANEIEKASRGWEIVCHLFYMYGVTREERSIIRIKLKIYEVAELLESAFKGIKNVL